MKIVNILASAALLIVLTGCTKPGPSKQLLEKQGFTSVEITGYNWFSCSEDDRFHTGFQAVSVTGAPVEGTVCSGWFFKGATIRFN